MTNNIEESNLCKNILTLVLSCKVCGLTYVSSCKHRMRALIMLISRPKSSLTCNSCAWMNQNQLNFAPTLRTIHFASLIYVD